MNSPELAAIPKREVQRYLMMKDSDAAVDAMIESVGGDLRAVVSFRIATREFEAEVQPETVSFAGCRIESRDLSRQLFGCTKIILLAATLGTGADLLARKFAATDMARAAVLQACAAAQLEACLDEWQAQQKCALKKDGVFLTPRYSPGYGDFPLCWQQKLLDLADAHRQIGVSLTGGGMLVPTKSVTAVLGIGGTEPCGAEHRCGACQKTDCPFRIQRPL